MTPDNERQSIQGSRSPVFGDQSLKILHVIPSVGPLRGGPSEALRTLTRRLSAAGLQVHVATTDDNGLGRLSVPLMEPIIEQRVYYWYFPRQTRLYTCSWPLSRWLAQHVPDYDLLHLHALFSQAPLAAAWWARRYRVPYIVRPLGVLNRWGMSHRHPWLKKVSFHLIERRVLEGAAAVHYTSEQERQEAAELGVTGKQVVIPNPLTVPPTLPNDLGHRFRSRYPQLKGKVVLLFLSRLDGKKGLDLLLPAFAMARAHCPELMLVLAGNGEPAYVSHLQGEAERLGVRAALVWPGFLTGEEKWAALAAADGFVLPSYSENFAVAVGEAMAVGLPVVISDQVGICREVAAAAAGIVIACDIEKLAQALVALAQNLDERRRMGAHGRELVRARFSAEVVTTQVARLYEEVLANRPRGRHSFRTALR